MARPRVSAAGGLAALRYVFRKGRAVGFWRLWRRMHSKNACKTCALGMGGAKGGMRNEAGHFPEVCKKSIQAQAGDMQGAIPEAFFRATPIGKLAWLTPRELEALGRLAFPLLAEPGDTHYRRISWTEALDRCGAAFRTAQPEEAFVYASGRSSNEAAFLLQLIARAYGTPNLHNCSFYCHQASGVALNQVYGSGTASIVLEDLEKADLAIVIGANPASNHPRLITQLVQLRRRGGTVIVINPLKELGLVRFRVPSLLGSLLFGSKISDLYLQPHIGGDIALLKALLKGLVERGGLDEGFVRDHTTGFEALRADLEASSWEELEAQSGVPRTQLDAAVAALLKAKRGIALWAMGLTHHAHGVDNILALSNLALARGWLGREGCGLLPIRGHSNVQGVGSMGVSPVAKEAFAKKLQDLYGIPPLPAGQDTFASMEAAAAGRIQASLQLGGNLFGSNPDRTWSGKALQNIPFTAMVSTKLNENHVHGRGQTTVILPALARDEEDQATSQESMFNFVRHSEGGKPSIEGEPKGEVAILAELAARILPDGKFDWTRLRSHAALREEIGRSVAGYGEITSGKEFQVEGRTFREPAFPTPDGRANFAVTPVPDFQQRDDELRLMTLRSEGQFNTVVYEDEDLYRGVDRRDALMLAAEDAARLGFAEGNRVRVESETGAMTATVFLVDIRPGNAAMYYPEANVLVPPKLDPRSRTPAFKHVAVRVRPWKSAGP
ncbi:MAG: FdhF/YdeP family oxidoreductase [Holophagaceae bacterium]|nr:FdhF/YdeP family oxidoreductase [Holophagaceae bacterium]